MAYSLPPHNLHILVHIVNLWVFFMSSNIQAQKLYRPFNNSITALFVFGDSTVDPGNNNYIPTIVKSNFPPYGRDFSNHLPTGRFSNGQLVTDYVASYVGVKRYVPPYLDPTLSIPELLTGVSFASASSGFDPLTAISAGVISIEKQVEYFREYKRRVEVAIGKERTKALIENAAVFVSAVTNDLGITYFGPGISIRRKTYTLSAYLQFLVQNVQQFIQELVELGVKTIAIAGAPPIGCLPALITINSDNAVHHRTCIEKYSSAARDYNQLLQEKLKSIETSSGANIMYEDIYTPLADLIGAPKKFGFDNTNIGCCGSGLLEVSVLCNSKSRICADPSKYVFWDSIHPTERTYYIIFQALHPKIDLFLKKKRP